MPVGFAILGAGRIGQVHAQAIAANARARLVAVADAFEESARKVADSFGSDVRDIDAIASSDDIDAVLICTPTNTHADLIEQFARAGKAIFCEKPIDLDIARVRTCLRVVEQTGTKLMVGFNRRFDPHFCAIKQAIDAGQIGQVEMANIISRDPGAPPAAYIKASGGIFKDMTIHDFDMARFVLGQEIDTVIASGSVQVDPEIGALGDYDSASIILTTARGQHCSISNSRRASYGYDQRIEVHGSAGMVSAKNQRAVDIELANAQGFTRPPLHDFFMTRYKAAYDAEIAAFIDALVHDTPLTPSGQDGFQALAIAEAALISAREGRMVKLSEVL
ncbi:MAG: inositol 2-dehydrogenase [Alphaproteobacteria bacterium]|nr:inositol 2-dehydrogenase [Alphaproteobacteria bacterium]